jgi:hypothetical protein
MGDGTFTKVLGVPDSSTRMLPRIRVVAARRRCSGQVGRTPTGRLTRIYGRTVSVTATTGEFAPSQVENLTDAR